MKTIDQLPAENVAQPVVFPGYMVVTADCGACGAEIIGVAPVGAEGLTCPECGRTDDTFAWVPDERSTLSHDGAWLTGELDFAERTWFQTATGDINVLWDEATEDAESAIERISLPLWLVRLIAFLVAIHNLIHARRS
jgi:hypothetical protein